jgi:hypothetical protein
MGQADRLAGVLDLGSNEVFRTSLDRIGDAEERKGTLGRRRIAPHLESGFGRAHRRVDVGFA